MNFAEKRELELAIQEITAAAQQLGLDFYSMRYEVCPADIIYTFGAYGMPTRYSHWSFGKAFHRMKLQYDYGLSKIYELVINSDPCYAFLLEGNSLIQNKLIIAHVLAHSDFFKNNARFSQTNRKMMETMSAAAERIHQYEYEHGVDSVEAFIDAVLSIQEHIDPSLISPPRNQPNRTASTASSHKLSVTNSPSADARSEAAYRDLWDLDDPLEQQAPQVSNAGNANSASKSSKADKVSHASPSSRKKLPKHPEKDLLSFIEKHSTVLEDWQRDILTVMREEMHYFWPQLETKIMNEGWASYWHMRIIRMLDLMPDEAIEFAKLNAAVVQPSKHGLNPYYLGCKIFEDIEKRWDQDKIFEVREMESDTSFLRNYLTKELVEELDLYVFEKQGAEWKITDKTWENVRDQLVYSRVNGGFPYIVVVDGKVDGEDVNHGELYLKHEYESTELDTHYVEKTLPQVYRLWGRCVHLETIIGDKPVLFSFDGKVCHRKFLE